MCVFLCKGVCVRCWYWQKESAGSPFSLVQSLITPSLLPHESCLSALIRVGLASVWDAACHQPPQSEECYCEEGGGQADGMGLGLWTPRAGPRVWDRVGGNAWVACPLPYLSEGWRTEQVSGSGRVPTPWPQLPDLRGSGVMKSTTKQ